MAFWDGTRWVPDAAPPPLRHDTRWRDWAATATMVIVTVALAIPFTGAFAATPRITLSPPDGPPGTALTISGTSFNSKTRVQITWDASPAGLPTAAVNGRGGFKVTIIVPNGSVGAHDVGAVGRASGTTGNQKNAAPPAPPSVAALMATSVFRLDDATVPVPTPAPTAVPTATPKPATPKPVQTATPAPTVTPDPTAEPTAVATPTSVPAPTAAPVATPTAAPTVTPSPTPVAPLVSGARALGVYVHDSAWNHALLDAYMAQVGRKPSFAGSFHEFTSSRSDGGERFPDFPNGYAPQVSQLSAWATRGIVPLLTWQPFRDYANGPDAAYTLATITAGNHDAEINAWATAAAAYGKPLYIRFAHEMNGDWYPWGQHINGNTPAQYVAAWRYVVNKFRAAGATNVKWVWAPNILYGNTWPITGLYPGDSYVDLIGMDGYNWGSSGKGPSGWFSFTTLFADLYDQVRLLAPSKPIYVAEVSSTESGGNKAAWITSAFLTEIPARFPAVSGVMWFDTTGAYEADWSISTSSSALAAFRAVAASPGWQGTLP